MRALLALVASLRAENARLAEQVAVMQPLRGITFHQDFDEEPIQWVPDLDCDCGLCTPNHNTHTAVITAECRDNQHADCEDVHGPCDCGCHPRLCAPYCTQPCSAKCEREQPA